MVQCTLHGGLAGAGVFVCTSIGTGRVGQVVGGGGWWQAAGSAAAEAAWRVLRRVYHLAAFLQVRLGHLK